MSKVVAFPLHRATRRASEASRERPANDAISVAVTPAFLTRGRAKMADHQTAGMESRCRHFSTANADNSSSPRISSAMSALEAHNSMISRKDLGVAMPESLGQIVCKHKANVSGDFGRMRGENPVMTTNPSKSGFKAGFLARTKQARVERGYTQAEMEVLLGLSKNTYKWYESRSLLPHDLIPRFCLLTDIDESWLYGNPVAAVGRKKRRVRRGAAAKRAKVA